MEKQENFYLTNTPVKKLLVKFSIPCILALLVSALYNIVDQIFIGNSASGTAGIMATTLVFPFTVIALALALLIGDGSASLFSISLGSKDKKTSDKCVGNAIILIIISSIILSLLGFVFKDQILNLLGSNGYSIECQKYALDYLKIILIGLPFYMFASSMSSTIRSDGSPLYSMMATITGAIINLILDPICIYVLNMGVKGAALATIIGQVISALISVIYFRKTKLIKLSKESFKLDNYVSKKIIKLGISSFITQISIAIITVVANHVVGSIGGVNATDAGGALGIVFKIFAIVLSFSIGTSIGGQPIIGYNYGAGKYDRVLDTYKLVLKANIIIGLIAFLIFELCPSFIVSLFGGHALDLVFYKNYAVLSFRIYLGGILFCCIQKSSCIFLQSIDRPYKAMILSLMRDVILLVPGVCILGLCGNLYTMLIAGPIADVGALVVTIILVSKEYKKISKSVKKDEVKTLDKSRYVITIGREFGSGGKYIGEKLAERLGIKCYDKEILKKVSNEYDISMDTLKSVDERQKSSFWYGFATNYVFSKDNLSAISAEDDLFLKQARVIEELYDNEDCVIIGRCSDFILKDKPNVINVFISSSDVDFKIKRKIELEKILEKDAIKKIERIDKERSNYYKHYTNQEWGDKRNYEICLDTSRIGVDECIDLLENYIKTRIK